MTCRELLELVEAIASADVEVTPALRSHLESCPGCAAALATATRIEAALAARPAPSAPLKFTPAVLSRLRRERWQSEQNVDRIFNVAIVVSILIIVSGVLTLTNLTSFMAAAGRGGAVLTTALEELARRAAPMVGAYVAAAGLLVSAVAMWWWAERRLSL